jgi:hypothetical protein
MNGLRFIESIAKQATFTWLAGLGFTLPIAVNPMLFFR